MGRRAGLASRLPRVTGLRARKTVEGRALGRLRSFRGKVYVGKEMEAMEVAVGWGEREHTVWADGF